MRQGRGFFFFFFLTLSSSHKGNYPIMGFILSKPNFCPKREIQSQIYEIFAVCAPFSTRHGSFANFNFFQYVLTQQNLFQYAIPTPHLTHIVSHFHTSQHIPSHFNELGKRASIMHQFSFNRRRIVKLTQVCIYAVLIFIFLFLLIYYYCF